MRKLRLDLEELAVESFDTSTSGAPRAGTVRGNIATDSIAIGAAEPAPVGTYQKTCMIDFCADSWQSGCLTCAGTCGEDTCQDTCKDSCYSCFGQETCYGYGTCITACLRTCPSGGDVCCA
ncbi:MAG TPA: hypothetical protein VF746_05760 [Longimicrobium sp.]|jgi:hypothetical protein